MDKFKVLVASRKFWAAAVGLLLVCVKAYRPDFPLSEEAITNVIYVLVAYIVGTAIESGGSSTPN